MSALSPVVQIEFTPGVWTDVSTDVDLTAGISIQYGRTSEFTDPQTATCSLQLFNHTGAYTPKTQVLSDGVTAHPYYPNVLPRRRVSVTDSAGGNHFFGYIKSWVGSIENGKRVFTTISATDRQDQEGRIIAQSAHINSMLADSPAFMCPMTDPAYAVVPQDAVSNTAAQWAQVGTGTYAFGSTANDLPISEGQTHLITNNSTFAITLPVPIYSTPANGASGASWNGCDKTAGNTVDASCGVAAWTSGVITQIKIIDAKDGGNTGTFYYFDSSGPHTVTIPSTPNDGLMHHYAWTVQDLAGGVQAKCFVDGIQVAVISGIAHGSCKLNSASYVLLGPSTFVAANQTAGPVAVYDFAVNGRFPTHAELGNGATLDTATRAIEYYYWAGVQPTDIAVASRVNPGAASVTSHAVNGKTITQLLSEMAHTEGGGSVAYHLPGGLGVFSNRSDRKPGAPVLTLDADKDLITDPFAPSIDDLTLITASTITRESGRTQTYVDAVAAGVYGVTADSDTTYSTSDADALHLAQYRVRSQAPALRLPQVAFDLLTAQSGVAAAWQSAQVIGARVRVANLPAGIKAGTQVDVLVEGWTENITNASWVVQLDASAADSPTRFVWDDTTYGRWGAQGMTLTSAITASSTSISVTTAANLPTFSRLTASYPLKIRIGEEELTVTARPAGSTSPQTLTVTRGTSGTTAAPQAAGVAVTLSPASCWTL